jgi:uncharacterized membrane protein YeaQ/YmgE (transglycosylase-associated protein family)
MQLLAFAAFGLLTSLTARFVVPGESKLSLALLLLFGVVGSVGGGVVATILVGARWDALVPAGWVGSLCSCATLLLAFATCARHVVDR